jgi:hypothetical protein
MIDFFCTKLTIRLPNFIILFLLGNIVNSSQQGCHAFSSSSCSGSFRRRRLRTWTTPSKTVIANPWVHHHHRHGMSSGRVCVNSNNDNMISIDAVAQKRYTHLIAIPLEDCREICVALESVQRAITYNCPSLEDACISTAQARLPLLYVDALNNEEEHSSEILHKLVKETIDNNNQRNETAFMMKFKGLEIDGSKNEVLYCVGKSDDEGVTTKRLQSIVYTLRNKIEALGYRTMLPPDQPQIQSTFNEHMDSTSTDEQQQQWRPRIPFMRLPREAIIDDANSYPTDLNDTADEELEVEWRTPEEGGNGISPILWYKWWNDEFTEEEGDGIKLREVAIYSRRSSSSSSSSYSLLDDLSEEQFRTFLPGGNNNNVVQEASKANLSFSLSSKIEEEEEPTISFMADSLQSSSTNFFTISTDFDSDLDTTLDINYTTAAVLDVDYDDDCDSVPIATSAEVEINGRLNLQRPTLFQRDNSTPDTEVLYNTYNEEDDTRSAEFKMKKPWPKEPLINKYNRMQGIKAEALKEAMQKKDPLPPYPSNEYFIGPWRVVSFPIDSNYANPDSLAVFESHNSDNMILRVDGSVAGGPFLDSKTKQKAAGGSWKMFQAEYIGPQEGMVKNNEKIIKTRMRIVLLIPPLKKEELVMEGEVTRITMPSSLISRPKETPEGGDEEDQDSLLHCGGEAWIREISTGRRTKLGVFSVVKLRTFDPSELHISVPPTRRGLQ